MEDIIQEKISADHLLYVSLKYTKTCDVIINLLIRWSKMIEISIEQVLEKSKERGDIETVPSSPMGKIELVRKLFKKDKNFLQVIDDYKMFRKIEDLRKKRIGEFRKNVTLKVTYKGEEVNIDLEMLKTYAERLEKFIKSVKECITSEKKTKKKGK